MRIQNKRANLHSQNYMDKVPSHTIEYDWKVRPDGLVEIDMEHTGFYNHLVQKFFHRPKKNHIALDRYGSVLWKNIDGDNTVFNLVSIMEEHFPNEASDMLKRVVTFLGTLERVRFITFKN